MISEVQTICYIIKLVFLKKLITKTLSLINIFDILFKSNQRRFEFEYLLSMKLK